MNKAGLLVSIICPAYNTAAYINKTIMSVINQSWTDWELIIIDDGSTDETFSVASALSLRDSRIRLVSSTNKGVSHARNIGLSLARGNFIAFLDSDDYLGRSYLSDLLVLFSDERVGVVGSGVVLVDDFENILGRLSSDFYGSFSSRLVRFDPGVSLATFYVCRAELLNNIKFCEDVTNSEDLFFWLSCASLNKVKYKGIRNDGYYYRQRSSSASKNLEGWSKGQLFILKKLYSFDLSFIERAHLFSHLVYQLSSYYIRKIVTNFTNFLRKK